MIRDPLYRAIVETLTKSLDPDTFEKCAASLLQGLYPGLVPVSGGSDKGMDGYYGPIDGDPMVLVATTSDRALDNLRRNITTYKASGGAARRAVLATSQVIGGTKRRNLEAAADKLGFVLIQIVDSAWFTDELYRTPFWRKELLCLTGDPPALSRIPPAGLPVAPIPLLGRDDDLRALGSIDDDVVLVGEPGVGKSSLLRNLAEEEWGAFVIDHDRGRLADAIREQQPKRVIIDDAHFGSERLQQLRHLREDIGLSFRIVAVTWPGHANEVRSQLYGATTFNILPLARDIILEVVQHVGVHGPVEFQRALVDQARGRPGLAATLALLAVRGSIREVASGEALFRETQQVYRRLLGDDSATVLGTIAVAGDVGLGVEEIANALRLDLSSVGRLVAGLSSGGTIGETNRGTLVVQPEPLRYAAVREVFFGGPGSLPLDTVLKVLTPRTAAALPLIGAAHRGARVDDGMLRRLVSQSSDRRTIEAYATLGESEAQFALTTAPDNASAIATAALHHSPRWALRKLMDAAKGDGGARHSDPDHPMRKISDWIAAGAGDERKTLLDVVEDWFTSGADGDLGLEALAYSLSPRVGWSSTDPGAGMTVTLTQGVLPTAGLEAIASFGDRALDLIPVPECKTYSPILEVLSDWLFPRRLGFRGELPAKQATAMRSFGIHLLRGLVRKLKGHPGLLARLEEVGRQARTRTKIEISSEFQALFPTRNRGTDWRRIEKRQRLRALRFAESLHKLTPSEVSILLTSFDRYAAEAGINYPRFVPDVCHSVAARSNNPEEQIEELIDSGAAGDLILPFLDIGIRHRRPASKKLLARLLKEEPYRSVAISVALSHPVGRKLQRLAVQVCDSRYAYLVESLILRDQIDQGALPLLLEHPEDEVARATAVTIRREKATLPRDIRLKWEQAILRCPADDAWYPEIMASNPNLLGKWVKAWLSRQSQEPRKYERIPQALLAKISELSVRTRRYLLKCTAGTKVVFADDLVSVLVGEDEELVKFIFDTAQLEEFRADALRGKPGTAWLNRARIALQRDMKPDDIVRASLGSNWSSWGPESQFWRGWVEAFEELGRIRSQEAQVLSAAGVAMFSDLKKDAEESERLAAIYGRR